MKNAINVVRLRNGSSALIINDNCEVVEHATARTVEGADVVDLVSMGRQLALEMGSSFSVRDFDHVTDWNEAVDLCKLAESGMTLDFIEVEQIVMA